MDPAMTVPRPRPEYSEAAARQADCWFDVDRVGE